MSPSLHNERTYLMERGPLQPNRGDIIIFNDKEAQIAYVKRVIALQGEQIQIKNGNVFINGEKLYEPYRATDEQIDFGPFQVPKNHVFVLGDNRSKSTDSRQFGPISLQQIRGKIVGYE